MSAATAKVLYRGPPGMRAGLYYFAGAVFTGTGCYQGFLLSQHMTLPLFTRDVSKAEMAPPLMRYAVAIGLAATGSAMGAFFFWTPFRIGTRVTFYPAMQKVGIRTAAPPLRAHLPASWRGKGGTELNPADPTERLFPWETLFRRDDTSAVGIQNYALGKPETAATDKKGKAIKIPSSLLLGANVSVAYQLEAAPVTMIQTDSKNMYKQWWTSVKLFIRGKTDWSLVAGQGGLTEAEAKAKATLHPKDPWFLDRSNFDSLFPLPRRK